MSELSRHNSHKGLVASLITEGLGYCCEAWFWKHFKEVSTELIAARLGVTDRAVRKHRAAFRRGEMKCENQAKCLNQRVPPAGRTELREVPITLLTDTGR